MTDDPRHDAAEEAEIIDGLEVYRDEDTGLWVAAHQNKPISSCGDTKEEAVENGKEAIELHSGESEGFDRFKCPQCEKISDYSHMTDANGVLREGQFFECQHCSSEFYAKFEPIEGTEKRIEIEAAASDTTVCPDCSEPLRTTEDMRGVGCPDCGEKFEIREVSYLVRDEG